MMRKLLLASLLLVGISQTPASGYVNITADSLHTWIASGSPLFLLDVREPVEYHPSHIEGTVLLPWNSKVLLQRYRELPTDLPIIVICGSGVRSALAAAFLDTVDTKRYSGHIFNLTGGMGAWPYEVVSTRYRDISADSLYAWIASGDSLFLLDVREQDEYDSGHLEGAVLYPWNSAVLVQRYNELPLNISIIVICALGGRAAEASAFLDTVDQYRFAGHIYRLEGGMAAWNTFIATLATGEISISSGLLSFGEVYVDSTAEKTFAIYNTGTAELTVSGISSASSEVFSVNPGSCAIAAGDSQIVTVAFTPQAAETYTDSIIITSDATEANTLSVGLSGTGITALAGDIDNSGRVDIFDLLELLKGLGKGSTARKADVNTDGQVNIFDLLALLKLLSGG